MNFTFFPFETIFFERDFSCKKDSSLLYKDHNKVQFKFLLIFINILKVDIPLLNHLSSV